MKRIQLRTWTLPLLLSATLFASCKGPCRGVTCNNGECVGEGECVCSDGYEGDNCDISNNQKFSGTYLMTELCDSSSRSPYTITLTPVPGTPNQFDLAGLYGQATVLRAQVETDGVAFTIDAQDIDGGKQLEGLSGTISIDAKTVNVSYLVYQGADTVDYCSGSLTK